MRVEPLGYLKQVLPEEGQVAQLVEIRIEDPGVGGSIPSLSTSVKGLGDDSHHTFNWVLANW